MTLTPISEHREQDDFEQRRALGIIERLSIPMTAVMKLHGDGPQPIHAGSNYSNTVLALRNLSLIVADWRRNRPRETVATPLGRRVIALMLASEADAMADMEAM